MQTWRTLSLRKSHDNVYKVGSIVFTAPSPTSVIKPCWILVARMVLNAHQFITVLLVLEIYIRYLVVMIVRINIWPRLCLKNGDNINPRTANCAVIVHIIKFQKNEKRNLLSKYMDQNIFLFNCLTWLCFEKNFFQRFCLTCSLASVIVLLIWMRVCLVFVCSAY